MHQDRTDRELLQSYLSADDHTAFAALVKRHGPLVLGVCRRELQSWEDAEDAFQATFLLLAQKGRSIRKRASLPSWLHGVAYRMACSVRRASARRRKHEGTVSPAAQVSPVAVVARREVQAVLDEEVQRLPQAQRVPFLLCILDGRSRAEAAAQLGLKARTLESRLARAKARLRQRLARRGLAPAAVLAALITARATASAVPGSLFVSTMANVHLLASRGAVPARVAVFLQGASKAMLLSTIKSYVVGAPMLAIAVGTAVFLSYPATPAAPATPEKAVASARPPATPDVPPRVASPAPAVPEPPPPEPVHSRAEDILAHLEKALAKVESLQVTCTRTRYDPTLATTEVFEGTFKFARGTRPGQGPRASLEMRKKGSPDVYEKHVLNGTTLYEFAPKQREVRVHQLPQVLSDPPGKQLLRLLFGMEALEARKHFELTLTPAPPNDRWYIYVKIRPRDQSGRGHFTRARLVLMRGTYLPRQLWIEESNGKEDTWDFPRVIDGAAIPEAEFAAPALPTGWRLVGPR
jgi:TIGR03009 family protein